jgi:hypothetical protein
VYPAAANAQALPPLRGVEHRALVRHIRVVEGHVVADRAALEALEQLAALIAHLPLTDIAHDYVADRVHDVREALVRHLPPQTYQTKLEETS